MQYILSKQFEKEFSKLPQGVKRKAIGALELFVQDHEHPSLRTHTLMQRVDYDVVTES